ncbi:MAG TPA: hypothetical protein VES89_11745 [Candidatus Competibacteraceae bacterium]|nr:hypothetical protein [Candidatus Competibacteraceae bacterium]
MDYRTTETGDSLEEHPAQGKKEGRQGDNIDLALDFQTQGEPTFKPAMDRHRRARMQGGFIVLPGQGEQI